MLLWPVQHCAYTFCCPSPHFPSISPGGRWAENYHHVSNLSLWFLVHVSPLCRALNSKNGGRMHLILPHMSVFHVSISPCWTRFVVQAWPQALQRNFYVSQGSKGLHIRDPLCARSVPLNPAALMCHIVAPFSSLIPTLSLSPMEVIRRALFMLDQRAGHDDLPCLMCNSLCGSLEMTGIGLGYTEFTVGSPVQQESKQWWMTEWRGWIRGSEMSYMHRAAA